MVNEIENILEKYSATKPFVLEYRLMSFKKMTSSSNIIGNRILHEFDELEKNFNLKIELFKGDECISSIEAMDLFVSPSYNNDGYSMRFTFSIEGEEYSTWVDLPELMEEGGVLAWDCNYQQYLLERYFEIQMRIRFYAKNKEVEC